MSADRVRLGWRVPVGVWERFEEYVAEKRPRAGPYLRFEIEEAMLEYLDEDDLLAEADELLRAHTDLSGRSSSTPAIGTGRYQGEETRKLNHRVDPGLKERFQVFADEHDATSYGRALAAALDAYTRGGRARRILDEVERAVAGADAGTTDEAVENDGSDTTESLSTADDRGAKPDADPTEQVSVEARHVIEVAERLTETDTFHEQDVKREIRAVVGDNSHVVEAYRDTVIEQTAYVPHPAKDGLYISESFRESLTVWADIETKAERHLYLKGFAAAFAVAHGHREARLSYRNVQGVIEQYTDDSYEISDQYAYDLMEALDGEPGFEYDRFHGQKQLRVDLDAVEPNVLEWALDQHGADPSDLGFDVDVTSYTAGSPPSREAVGDD
ncbi:hypothetical protein BRC81_03070 [Halobacteriales archaeon QS_1_68_20]|nr:MAG: hypothetical protein BRC81_03070 [Halobacteriales archaeon QS_1_68_20]